MSAPIDLTILVYETAIVFEGETDSYRYDLTGSGIVAGTQVADVIAEARGQLHAQRVSTGGGGFLESFRPG